jgi:hypothetical protein
MRVDARPVTVIRVLEQLQQRLQVPVACEDIPPFDPAPEDAMPEKRERFPRLFVYTQ